jgi:hypothetical protein
LLFKKKEKNSLGPICSNDHRTRSEWSIARKITISDLDSLFFHRVTNSVESRYLHNSMMLDETQGNTVCLGFCHMHAPKLLKAAISQPPCGIHLLILDSKQLHPSLPGELKATSVLIFTVQSVHDIGVACDFSHYRLTSVRLQQSTYIDCPLNR